jgi:hypothetical protein
MKNLNDVTFAQLNRHPPDADLVEAKVATFDGFGNAKP